MTFGLGVTLLAVLPNEVIAQPKYEYGQQEEFITLRGYEGYVQAQVPKKRTLDFNPYSCVSYAKSLTGFSQSVGAARNWPRNVSEAVVGGVVVTNEGPYGHVAVITRVWVNTFEVTEANYVAGKVTTREINKNNQAIIGYWR